MKPLTATVDDLISWGPCSSWTHDAIRVYAKQANPRRKRWTALQILELPLRAKAVLWIVLRPELIDERTLRIFTCDCAERLLRHDQRDGRKPEPALATAVRVARKYASGDATREDLRRACFDAYVVDSIHPATIAAEQNAHAAASEASACAAMRSPSCSRERRWQRNHLKKLLTKTEAK